MTDDWADDGSAFDDAFFSALEASPDEVAEADSDDLGLDLEGDGGMDEFLYEAEEDGTFETDAADLDGPLVDEVPFEATAFGDDDPHFGPGD